MNILQLQTAAEQLRSAHQFTIKPKDRLEIQHAHTIIATVLQRMGVFIGFTSDKTSAPSQGDPFTPDPACPHCEGAGNGIGSVFDRCICTYGGAGKPPIMDEDDARKHDQKQANATLEHNIACMVSDYENGNIAGGRLRWAAIKADLRGLS